LSCARAQGSEVPPSRTGSRRNVGARARFLPATFRLSITSSIRLARSASSFQPGSCCLVAWSRTSISNAAIPQTVSVYRVGDNEPGWRLGSTSEGRSAQGDSRSIPADRSGFRQRLLRRTIIRDDLRPRIGSRKSRELNWKLRC